jgi:hypothetical protein
MKTTLSALYSSKGHRILDECIQFKYSTCGLRDQNVTVDCFKIKIERMSLIGVGFSAKISP